MRTFVFLMGCAFLTASVYATDKQAIQSAESNMSKTTVAVVGVNQAQAARRAAAPASKTSKADGDSRLNDYRLERESCCGPMQ
ncbi:MAG TPA: hypothetical protein VKF40_08315 [Burkholderiales bacterium]|nr:hypothetical protein [Burkholderiales bacterium]